MARPSGLGQSDSTVAAVCASADSSLRTRKLNRSLRVALSEAQVPCRNPLLPLRRRNARTAHECGAVRSEFGRRSGDARLRRRLANGAAAAERAPERRAMKIDRRRRRVSPPSLAVGVQAIGRRLRVADPPPRRRRSTQAPFRRRDASSFENPRRASSILVSTERGQSHFRWKRRVPAVAMGGEQRVNGLRRERLKRRRRAAQRVEDQNKSGDCGAPARPLMSDGGTLARRRAIQGGWRPNSTGRTAGNGAVPALKKRTSRGRGAVWTISCSSSSTG